MMAEVAMLGEEAGEKEAPTVAQTVASEVPLGVLPEEEAKGVVAKVLQQSRWHTQLGLA